MSDDKLMEYNEIREFVETLRMSFVITGARIFLR